MSNTLGRVLRYFADAWRYASGENTKAAQRVVFSNILSGMASAAGYNYGEEMDTDAAYRLAVTSAWVWSDIKLIADRVAGYDARPQVKRMGDDGLENDDDHPFVKLLAQPNALMSGGFLLRYTAWWYLLRGNAFVFVSTQRPGVGEPQEIWPLPADLVRPLPETLRNGVGAFRGRQVVDFEYNVNGELETLPGENVIHFRMPNPFDWWNGLSPLTAALMGIQTDHAQGKWARDFFGKDNAVPTAVISLPPEINEIDFEAAKEQIREQFGEGRRSAITRAGDLSVEVIQQTLEQMQMIAAREFNRDEIDRVYGIPQGLVSGGLSGDSRLAAEIAFARNTVQPTLDYFAEEWSAGIGPYYGDDVVISAPNVIPQDRALEVQEYSIYSQDRTIDENRAEMGLQPTNLPLANIPVRLLNLVAQGAAVSPDVGALAGAPSTEQVVESQAGKAFDVALAAELKRWKKVALKEAREGRNPAKRTFESDVIPSALRQQIVSEIDGADEAGVKAAFEGVDVSKYHGECYGKSSVQANVDTTSRDELQAILEAAAMIVARGV